MHLLETVRKRPLKITSNEIKCISHFKPWSKDFSSHQMQSRVSELYCHLHAQCLVAPTTVLFQQLSKSFNFKIISLGYTHQGLWRSMNVIVIFIFLKM